MYFTILEMSVNVSAPVVNYVKPFINHKGSLETLRGEVESITQDKMYCDYDFSDCKCVLISCIPFILK